MNKTLEKKLRHELSDAHHSYGKGLKAYAYYKLHNKETSEDLVQDVFAKTWIYLQREGKIRLMKAFLYHVLNNLIIDEYRKRKAPSLDDLIEKGFEPGLDESGKLFDSLDGRAAMLMIDHLPLTYRASMRMRYAEGLSIGEIAQKTGQTKGAVAVQTHRGLGLLRELCRCEKAPATSATLALAERIYLARQAWIEVYRVVPVIKIKK